MSFAMWNCSALSLHRISTVCWRSISRHSDK